MSFLVKKFNNSTFIGTRPEPMFLLYLEFFFEQLGIYFLYKYYIYIYIYTMVYRIHVSTFKKATYRVRHLVFLFLYSLSCPSWFLAFRQSNRIFGGVSENFCKLTELHPRLHRRRRHRHHQLPTRRCFRYVLRLSLQVHHHRRHRFISFPLFLLLQKKKKQRQAWNFESFWGLNGRIRRFFCMEV